MSDAKQFIVGGIPVLVKDKVARDSIGDLSELTTTNKSNLVEAINEAAQSGGGEGSDPEAVKYTSQSLTSSQKEQARTNIGAQETLVGSGTGQNIKTINGDSILGSGDLTVNDGVTPNISIGTVSTGAAGSQAAASISGTAAAPVLNLVIPKGEQGETGATGATGAQGPTGPAGVTSAQASVDNTSSPTPSASASVSNGVLSLAFTGLKGNPGEDGVGFETIETPQTADGTALITLTNGDTITLDLNHDHPAYYSKVAETSNPSGGFIPDVVYSLGTLTGTVTFALAAAVAGNVNHYFWMFDTGSTAPTITWPAGITWADSSAPTVAASKHYEVSILGGIAYYSEV